MIDVKAFFTLNYGLYIISAKDGEQSAGCIVNTLSQVTAVPERMTVAVHKDNITTGVIQRSGRFTGVALAQSASSELIGRFGFQSSADIDKFAGFQTKLDENGVPFVCEQVVARFSCKVIDSMDAGTHIIFLGEVTAAEAISQDEPMTYAYYHKVKNGITPPRASSSQEPPAKSKGFRCTICGYVLESDTLPDDFICPICKRGSDVFEKTSV